MSSNNTGKIVPGKAGDYALLARDELVRRLVRAENEQVRLLDEQENAMKDVNRRMQMHLAEIRSLKEANEKLAKESLELRDLCCFLDDDRQKGQKLAREWQKFGRYSSDYLHTEFGKYQEKLEELEGLHHQMTRENVELKELIVLLDEERSGSKRNSICSNCSGSLGLDGRPMENGPSSEKNKQSNKTMDDSTRAYIERLEDRIHFLEDEKRQRTLPRRSNGPIRDDRGSGQGGGSSRPSSVPPPPYNHHRAHAPPQPPPRAYDGGPSSRSPDMVNALKVLEVHDQLDSRSVPSRGGDSSMDDNEKAIVREMCNVVWRKLGDPGVGPPHPGVGPERVTQGPNQSHIQSRYSTGSTGPPPVRHDLRGDPRYPGSTQSLDRKGY